MTKTYNNNEHNMKNYEITFHVGGFLEETVDIQSTAQFQRFILLVVSTSHHGDELFGGRVHFQKTLQAGNDRLLAHLGELVAGLKCVLVLAVSAEATLDGLLFLGVADGGW